MIDEKKIEEAAQGAADLYEQDLPIMSYNEDTEVDGQHHFCQEFGAELFKDGAKWAINEFLKDLWHPYNKEPRNRSNILYLNADKNIYGKQYVKEDYKEGWSDFVCFFSVWKWSYQDDLLSKEGGEQ